VTQPPEHEALVVEALAPGEALESGARRVALSSIEAAAIVLRSPAGDPDLAVHEARKALKRARAILRLCAAGLAKERFREERVTLRDLGRDLATARDRRVLGDTLRALAERVDDPTVRERLLAVAPPASGPASPGALRLADPSMPVLLEGLDAAARRVATWPDDVPGEADARAGLRGTHRSGRRRMRAALEASAAGREDLDDPYHRWRTRVKDLLYQLQLFAPAWPDVLVRTVEDVDVLGDALGTHHDLWLARRWLGRNEPQAAAATAGPLEERLAEVRAIADHLGPRLYDEASARLADGVLTHWRGWHRQDGGAPPP